MNPSVEIRRLQPFDWALLRELRLRALRDSPQAFASSLERELGFDEGTWRRRCETSFYFVAESDGQACGLVCGYQPGDEPDSETMIEVVSMWVDPAWRRRGIGSLLIGEIIALARRMELREVRLWVAGGNDVAMAVYKTLGFEETGETQPLPHFSERCESQMRLRLS